MRTTITILALAITLAACGSTSTTATATSATATTTTQAVDPWETLQANAKAAGIDATFLDRDEALARALLGCGTTWPPNTLDALLAQAYALQINQARAAGHC